jgi:hypothetical protein
MRGDTKVQLVENRLTVYKERESGIRHTEEELQINIQGVN